MIFDKISNFENGIGLYIHIPFCRSKCFYCDFNSFANRDELIPLYFNALKKEIEIYSDKLKRCKVKTVFIGGGTPSLVDADYIRQTIQLCAQSFDIESGAEISMEANPGTLLYHKLISYRESGINRISIGLQAWQNDLLRSLGRIHSREEFLQNFRLVKEAGFENINVDLIFGLPGQTLHDWEETLSNIIELETTHLSCYSLKVEAGTVFGEKLKSGELAAADDELDREMYYLAIRKLGEAGFKHYELSNFAKAGFQCRHNLIYWKAVPYLGLGAGAHSYLDKKRFNNKYPVEDYIPAVMGQGSAVEDILPVDRKDEIAEFIILGLRLVDGISISEFKSRFNEDIFDLFPHQIDKLLKRNLISLSKDSIKLSSSGLDLANQVFMEFI